MTASHPLLETLLDRSDRLYSLPGVAIEVLRLTSDPGVDAARLRAAVEHDPALSSRILGVVNSSLFGLGKPVTDQGQAIALLGLKSLKLLVLGFSLPDRLFLGLAGDVLSAYWQRTLTKAVAARELARQARMVNSDEAFLAGLLQDLGQLVLLQQVRDPYVKFVRSLGSDPRNLLAYERSVLGFDHTELSSRLLARWGLPPLIVQAVSNAPTAAGPALEAAVPLRQVVELADRVCELLVDLRSEALDPLLAQCEAWLGLPRPMVLEVVGRIQRLVEDLAQVLSLKLPADWDYSRILTEAHQQLAEVARQVAGDLAQQQTQRGISPPQQQAVSELAAALVLPPLDPIRCEAPLEPESRLPRQGRSTRNETSSADRSQVFRGAPSSRGGNSANEPSPSAQAPGAVSAAADEALLERVRQAAAACRQARQPLSLILVELDGWSSLVFYQGLDRAEAASNWVPVLAAELDQPGLDLVRVDEPRWMLLVPGADRLQAVDLARRILRAVRERSLGETKVAFRVSVGTSTAGLLPKNFAGIELLDSALRCLTGAQLSGGDSLKSIEI